MAEKPSIDSLRDGIKGVFDQVRPESAIEAVMYAINNPFKELEIRIAEVKNFSFHFNLQKANEILAAERIVKPNVLFNISTLLNAPAMYAYTMRNAKHTRIEALVTVLNNFGANFPTNYSDEQVKRLSNGLAESNATFQNMALLSIGYVAALGTRQFTALRSKNTLSLQAAQRDESVVIDTIVNFLGKLGMTEKAKSVEEIYERLLKAYSNNSDNPGVMSALLADNRKAFRPNKTNRGCPGVSYASRTFNAFGEILRDEEVKNFIFSILQFDSPQQN